MKRVILVAEAGINHEGDEKAALSMVTAAAMSGVDVIKFQSYRTEKFLQKGNPLFSLFKRCELSIDTHRRLVQRAKREGIQIASTPLDISWVQRLHKLRFDFIKIASGDITFLPLLREAGKTGLPVILSTGMSTLKDIQKALDVLSPAGSPVSLLHCVSCYPPRERELHLSAINTLAARFSLPVGFSDHTPGIHTPALAVAAGARLIEKHFTLDRNLPGPDQRLSLEPAELKEMVARVREAERVLGSSTKKPTTREMPIKSLARRGVYASRDIPVGHKLLRSDIQYFRPEQHFTPFSIEKFIGCRLLRGVSKNSAFQKSDFVIESR